VHELEAGLASNELGREMTNGADATGAVALRVIFRDP
jgi:hypothetical protein